MKIPFNKPYLTGEEIPNIQKAIDSLNLSGNGRFTKNCQQFFEDRYGIFKALLTTSCTDALEMAAILAGIKEGDEVIIPSYTFVSTANAFVLRGAKVVFCDSRKDHPGIDESSIEACITERTKAIIPVHYAGVSCNMELIMEIANRHRLLVIEDAAQAIDSYFTFSNGVKKPLGSIGHLAAFSFHETKNIISGEGGLLAINDQNFSKRAEIIWEKGTNRTAFHRGEVDKYGWVDVGSSFLPSETIAAFLWAQLNQLEQIQNKRKEIWNTYFNLLNDSGIQLPSIPDYATNNAHMFYLVCDSLEQRSKIIETLKKEEIAAVFHYLSLHASPYFISKHDGRDLPNADNYSNRLLRLPFYYDITLDEQEKVAHSIKKIL